MGRKQKTTNQILTSNIIPTETQKIARVLGSRGKNLHEVQYYEGTVTLCSLPPKFRSLIWVKRGSYVIIEPLESDKVKKIGGEIVHVLFPEHVKHLKSKGIWPKEFENQEVPDQTRPSGDDSDDQIFVNTNRIRNTDDDDNSSSDEE
ncbi:nucleic acid-binding protein [Gigaspora margarita]|uniref:Nucleic acid-binding protein n=1 Tax=Gigaspora margarita TaxID=4874 RepID=A0A8H3WVP3_GIGMA|nr:nucleic acid-binding protein [Gigaspora margarita]